jgi:hypothetical protein
MSRSEKYLDKTTERKKKEENSYLLLGLLGAAREGATLGGTESRTCRVGYRSSSKAVHARLLVSFSGLPVSDLVTGHLP